VFGVSCHVVCVMPSVLVRLQMCGVSLLLHLLILAQFDDVFYCNSASHAIPENL